MPYERDPLSVRYDGTVRQTMMRAIRSSRNGKGIQAYVASPRSELRSPDAGGRTAHERAFTRSAYYLVWRAPINAGRIPDWSLKVTWGPDSELQPSSEGRMARPVRLRVFPRRGPRGGRQHGHGLPAVRQWAANDELRSGGIGSPWARFTGPGGETRTTSYRQQLARERTREQPGERGRRVKAEEPES